MVSTGLNKDKTLENISAKWEDWYVKGLSDFIRVPNLSPNFDAEFLTNITKFREEQLEQFNNPMYGTLQKGGIISSNALKKTIKHQGSENHDSGDDSNVATMTNEELYENDQNVLVASWLNNFGY